MKLAEVAQKLGCRLEGPPELEIRGVAGIEHAEAGQISFLANRRYFPLLKTTRASAVLVEEGIALDRHATLPAVALLRSSNPYLAFAHALELFYQPPRYAPGIHPTAIIAKSAKIGEGAHVGPTATSTRTSKSAATLRCTVSSLSIEAQRLATIFLPMRTPSCANFAASAIA